MGVEVHYTGSQWKEDYAMDEAGAFPKELKRGVLSQDGIWNMLERNRELAGRLGITEKTGEDGLLTEDDMLWRQLYEAAKSVQNGRKISEYVEAGGVAAAILSSSGRIYTGVCVDTCSTLGICAERNAIFNMLTNGEQKIRKVLAILPNGRTGAPCGACRELMVQLMPGTYKEIEIMLDYENNKVITLGELTPEWWIG